MCIVGCKAKQEEVRLDRTKALYETADQEQGDKIKLIEQLAEIAEKCSSQRLNERAAIYIAGGTIVLAAGYFLVKKFLQ